MHNYMKDRDKEPSKEGEKESPKRVIIENQDGTIRYLEGADAEKWDRVVNGLVTLGFVHGHQGQDELASLNWKVAKNLNEMEERIT